MLISFLLSSSISQTVLASDLDVVRERRVSSIIGSTTGATSVATWLGSLGTNGQWPDVDYTSGCDAQRASWPAQTHWSRLNTLSAAWHGGLRNAGQYTGNATVRASVSRGLDFWFSNDFATKACLDLGGTDTCPCSTPGFWNGNWASNVILIPAWVGQVCLLLGDSLLSSEVDGCLKMTGRSYNTFTTGIHGVSAITGANTLDIASIGIDLSLFSSNPSLLAEAYTRVHQELAVKDGVKVDGIRSDGAFGQHSGILYNGNYGERSSNNILTLELGAADTQYQAGDESKSAFDTLFLGNQWMVFLNTVTGVLHWDYSVLVRIIAVPVADNQATANLKTNLTQLQLLGQQWNSSQLLDAYDLFNTSSSSANPGTLVGNKMFYTNDYMVHRGAGYVTTLKMFSKRTQNTECTNSQNPFGFHLSDGAMYTFVQGNEYEDIFAAWDWNLIPGITTDYGATPLSCDTARKTGNQPLVGGASDGVVGVAAMRYDNPTTRNLTWRKTWFFLKDDIQVVMIARVNSTNTSPIYSVLDQRRRGGDVFVNGAPAGTGNFSSISSLWHGGVGYAFNATSSATTLSLQLNTKTGSWADISTSKQPSVTVDMFTAWLNHVDPTAAISYSIFPATTLSAFQSKSANSKVQVVRNDGSISALLDFANRMAMLVYWVEAGGSATLPSVDGAAPLTVKSSGNVVLILDLGSWSVTASDPTQALQSVALNITIGTGSIPPRWPAGSSRAISSTITLPSGSFLGASITQPLLFPE
ncbi:polysaccharide lyase family 8 protein [Pluteus cervinus]|uniref:Polysaccharide lyase family 8 protein n=1 Tax=Pluteus cervinus TaxID=181527 RepID=A0ACD3BGP3_9AGAR|nr:polysaccharide lyase family 8 protein [Pluteus cervinus]